MHDLDMNVCEFVFLSSVDLFISFMIYFSFKNYFLDVTIVLARVIY